MSEIKQGLRRAPVHFLGWGGLAQIIMLLTTPAVSPGLIVIPLWIIITVQEIANVFNRRHGFGKAVVDFGSKYLGLVAAYYATHAFLLGGG